ncbi:MAG: T9SS type A sorting domain-containing protein [Cyclobacteriaceae bacterium]|nr:T9SS type A sorting domain-containing protein [Cyclobacteriaceae bacterium]
MRHFLAMAAMVLIVTETAFSQPANDNRAAATDVTSLINTCSSNAAYTTLAATADQSAGTCAANGPNYNVWFKFTATATGFINIQRKTGGAFGTQQYGWLTLWDAGGTQLACTPYNNLQYGTMELSYLGLTNGSTYYISVDNYTGTGYRGTFTLCLNDVVDYDYKSGATDVTSLINACSANAAYTTIGASADQAAGTCAPNGPNYNRWFQFTASATGFINVQLKTGGVLGTMQYGWATLWTGAGAQLACTPYNSQQSGTMELSYLGLTPGVNYYISIDNYVGLGYRGTFSLCLSDVVDYNFKSGATDVTSLINSCSANAAYTTLGASGDQAAGTCAPNGPNYNRWFQFTASASGYINVQLKTGGALGTMQYGWVTVWDGAGTQLSCSPYVSQQYGTMETSYLGLTPGATYYISVDNYVGAGYRGTFSLCLSDVIDYNFKSGAVDVTSLLNSCSANAAYTTVGASADQAAGTCAPNGPNYNRWFAFTASASGFINVQLKTGGVLGTMQYGWATLWDGAGTQLACSPYVSQQYGTMETSYLGLTPGATYYISVDNYVGAGYRGTFSLCLSDVIDYNYKSGAMDVNSLINSCSANAAYTTVGASADQAAGTCAANGPNYNRWFQFTATATGFINVQLKTGGALGNMQYGWVTLWTGAGAQLACSPYNNQQFGTQELGYLGLTPGVTYYISVDNYVGAGYRGTFSLCLSDVVDYNFRSGALDVTSLFNSCSANAAYTTIGASADQAAGTCAPNGPNYNRWFQFTASATGFINVQLKTGGALGTMQYSWVTLWDGAGTQLVCSPYNSQQYGTMEISALGLTPGATYYVSVDNYAGAGYRGTFSMCFSDVVDYNFKSGATDVTSLMNSCSANAAYSTIGASADQSAGTCAPNGPNYNRWFKFTAGTTGFVNVQMKTGGSLGTLQYGWVTIWDGAGTQLACSPYNSQQYGTMEVGYLGLTPGNVYYISVDNYVGAGYRGTFSMCFSDVVDYNFKSGATDVSSLMNTCSANAAYTTVGASADQAAGTCAPNGPNYNRWFKFTATSTGFINAQLKTGGAFGNMQYGWMTLWTGAGTQLTCTPYNSQQFGTMELSYNGLSPGTVYYLSVDNYVGAGYRGTFSLCVNDILDYDYYEGAYELTNLNNWCSSNGAFTTIGAGADKNAGSCWPNGPNYNRWFKFVAVTASANIQLSTGGAAGTLQYPSMALWQSNGTTQIACSKYTSQYVVPAMVVNSLVPGNTYYISVDNYVGAGYRGTFRLCINNVGTTYYSRASGTWNTNSTWSVAGYGGAAATSFPTGGDVALIQGYDITVSSAQSAAQIDVNAATANTSLTVDNATLTVNGQLSLINSGSAFTGGIVIQNNGRINVNDVLNVTRSGGSPTFGVTVNTGSTLAVNSDINFTSSGGSVAETQLTVNGTGTVTTNRDLNLTSTGGTRIHLVTNNTSQLSALRDINFTANAAGLELIELNNTSRLNVGRNINRGATPYGSILSNASSSVAYNGAVYVQNVAGDAGSGGDSFTYYNLIINNTRPLNAALTLTGALNVNGTLTLTSGILTTTSTNVLNLKNASVSGLGSTTSYISGPMTYEVASSVAGTTRNFPIGKGTDYRPMVLTVSHTSASSVIYTAEHFASSAAALGYTLPPTVDRVSGVRYWRVTSSDQSVLGSAQVRLYYGYGTDDGVTSPANLTVVKNIGVGTTWFDVGGTATGTAPGNILSGTFTSFSDITIADLNGGGNPLPVTLSSFTGEYSGESVSLNWTTSSELNNDYFLLERSTDAREFAVVAQVPGSGTTTDSHSYHVDDLQFLSGINYYRLVQVDMDGRRHPSQVIAVTVDLAAQVLRVYPNPVTGSELTVQWFGMDDLSPLVIRLTSISGKTVQKFEDHGTLNDRSGIKIDTGGLASGIYILSVTGPHSSMSRRIIIP